MNKNHTSLIFRMPDITFGKKNYNQNVDNFHKQVSSDPFIKKLNCSVIVVPTTASKPVIECQPYKAIAGSVLSSIREKYVKVKTKAIHKPSSNRILPEGLIVRITPEKKVVGVEDGKDYTSFMYYSIRQYALKNGWNMKRVNGGWRKVENI